MLHLRRQPPRRHHQPRRNHRIHSGHHLARQRIVRTSAPSQLQYLQADPTLLMPLPQIQCRCLSVMHGRVTRLQADVRARPQFQCRTCAQILIALRGLTLGQRIARPSALSKESRVRGTGHPSTNNTPTLDHPCQGQADMDSRLQRLHRGRVMLPVCLHR